MSDRPRLRAELVAFLNTVAKLDSHLDADAGDGFDDATNLVDAGIIDSLALIEIVSWLEENHDVDFRALGIDPGDLASIEGILDAIARAGE